MLTLAVALMVVIATCPALEIQDTPDMGLLPSMRSWCSSPASFGLCFQQPLRIAAWNLQRFGVSKMGRPEVVQIITQVVQMYDVMVLQEVTDLSGTAIPQLLTHLNKGQPVQDQYKAEVSPRTGRTSYKEQYAFLYKPSRVEIETAYKYDDVSDVFQVEPFVAVFLSNWTGPLTRFAVIPLHAKPSDVIREVDALVDVYDDMRNKMGLDDAFLIGDFNAGCSYLVQGEYEKIRLHTEDRFHWLISDHADTTTRTTSCPYDRIVVAGASLQATAYYKTAAPYYFDEAHGIKSSWSLVADVSDHYPVGVMMRGTIPRPVRYTYQSSQMSHLYPPAMLYTSVSVRLLPGAPWSDVTALAEGKPVALSANCSLPATPVKPPVFTKATSLALIEWTVGSLNEAVDLLIRISEVYPNVLAPESVSVLGYKLGHGVLRDPSVYLSTRGAAALSVALLCVDRAGQPLCTLTVSAGTGVN